MERSKELIDMLHKCRICSSYKDPLFLYVIRDLRDAETSKTCALGIACGKPPIDIVDNNDFKIETLTGNATNERAILATKIKQRRK